MCSRGTLSNTHLPCLFLSFIYPNSIPPEVFLPSPCSSIPFSNYIHIYAYLQTFLLSLSDYWPSVGLITSSNLYVL